MYTMSLFIFILLPTNHQTNHVASEQYKNGISIYKGPGTPRPYGDQLPSWYFQYSEAYTSKGTYRAIL